MWIPREFSEPVPVCIDPIWKSPSPMIFPRMPLPVYHSRANPGSSKVRLCSERIASGSFHSSIHDSVHSSAHGSVHGSINPSFPPTASLHPSITDTSQVSPNSEDRCNKRHNRCWLMKLLMAPCDCVEWMISKWGKPSKDCMNYVKVTYWIVLIVEG